MKKKYRAYGIVTGSKYLGEFEAESAEEAIELASQSDEAYISLCSHCSSECESAEIHDIEAEEAS